MKPWMIADDEADIRNIIKVMFQAWGRDCIEFGDGSAALAWLETVEAGTYDGELPDLIVLDMRMPGYFGNVIARRMRGMAAFQDTPIILITAFALTDVERTSMMHNDGIDHIITKPLPDLIQFKRILDEWYAKKHSGRSTNAITVTPPSLSDQSLSLITEDELRQQIERASRANAASPSVVWTAPTGASDEFSTDPAAEPEIVWGEPGYSYEDTQPVLPVLVSTTAQDQPLPRERASSAPRRERPPIRDTSTQATVLLMATHADAARFDYLDHAFSEVIRWPEVNPREGVARHHPTCVVLAQPNVATLDTLRSFKLGQLPIVLALDPLPAPDEQYTLFEAGADEICAQRRPSDVISAINAAISQYRRASSPDKHITLFCANTDLSSGLKAALKASYSVTIQRHLDALAAIRTSDVIIFDARLGPLEALSATRIDTIVLIDDPLDYTYTDLSNLGIRGVLPLPVELGHLLIILNRLHRRRVELDQETLTAEIWQTWLDQSLLTFKHKLSTEHPAVARLLLEIHRRNQGILHDFRRVLHDLNHDLRHFSTVNHAEKIGDVASPGSDIANATLETDLIAEVTLASLHYQAINEARFTADWTADTIYEKTFAALVAHTIRLASRSRPDINFQWRIDPLTPFSSWNNTAIWGDHAQIGLALWAMLVILADVNEPTAITVEITQIDAHAQPNVALTFTSPAWTAIDWSQALPPLGLDTYAAGLRLVAYKILARHEVAVETDPTSLILRFARHASPLKGTDARVRLAELVNQHDDLARRQSADPLEPAPYAALAFITVAGQHLLSHLDRARAIVEPIEDIKATLQVRRSADDAPLLKPSVNLRHARLLANQLLLANAGTTPAIRPIDLHELLDDLKTYKAAHFTIAPGTITVATGTPPVLADALILLQILINLVDNAIAALRRNKHITIQAAPGRNGTVEITVSDTGCGIKPDHLAHIFDLYFTTRAERGRGIGLYVVKSGVAQLNGSITVESVVDQGTTFTITLPAAKA